MTINTKHADCEECGKPLEIWQIKREYKLCLECRKGNITK